MATIEYETPQDFFDALNQEFDFAYDVASSFDNAKCRRFFTKDGLFYRKIKDGKIRRLKGNDGLKERWYPRLGAIWLNPPYDKSIGLWIKKAYDSSQKGCTVVCLIQGRSTDTKMWHNYVMRASEIRFIKDRLHFGFNGKSARANISSVIVIFKPFCIGPPKVSSIDTKGKFLK